MTVSVGVKNESLEGLDSESIGRLESLLQTIERERGQGWPLKIRDKGALFVDETLLEDVVKLYKLYLAAPKVRECTFTWDGVTGATKCPICAEQVYHEG